MYPVCYRHPDRETYLKCVRCDRPICPDCAIEAPVGFQCPECVAAHQPKRRSTWLPSESGQAIVSWSIVGIASVIFVFELILGINNVAFTFGMQPASIALNNEWYRLITAIFLHGSIIHLLFNMYVLVILGPPLERILGHGRFLILFLVAGLGGSVASYVFSSPISVSVGASGAIFGLMGALVIAGRRLKFDIGMVVVLIAINVAIGFVFSAGIDWRAHLGGLATGMAVAAVFVRSHGRARLIEEVSGIAAILVVLGLVTAWGTASLL